MLDQATLAVTLGMGGAILLLLTGTQILDWYWVVLLVVGSLGVGLYRLRNSIPSFYQLAQRIDHKLNLADTLSTACYFSSPAAPGDEAIRQRLEREAESVARSVDVRQGISFTRPRFVYPALGLAAIAFALFAVRYAATGSLSLQPSLIQIAFDTFFPSAKELAQANPKKPLARDAQISPGSPDTPTTQTEAADQSELEQVDTPDGDAQAQDKGKASDKNGNDQGDQADKGDNADNDLSNQNDGKQGDNSKNGDQKDAKQDSKSGGNQQQESSLMNKLRDAMSNMLAKMKSPSNSNQQSSNSKQGQKDQSNQKQSKSDKASQNEAASDQQQGEAGDKTQSADSGNEKGSESKASQDSKSGIGSADGDKAAREAEQLAAMGKITEIFGKRSANIAGEVMVEVGSSKQPLKTPWSQRQTTHGDSGGELHRDEVPLMYQQFVQHYFEGIRKLPPANGAAKPAGSRTPRKSSSSS